MESTLRTFGDTVRVPESDLDLAHAALCIAQIEYPALIPSHHMKRLDELAATSGVIGISDPLHALHRLREFLFEEERFRGNVSDYYDPRNSCLNDVLDRKLGIPITLALVMIEVGMRVGLRLVGIGLPGHFVVSAQVGTDRVLLDPFDAGSVLTLEGATAVVSRSLGRPVKLTEADFAAASKRQVLARMLQNLKPIYMSRAEWPKSLEVVERLLILEPDARDHIRDRGSILVKLGHLHRGLADWERYLIRHADAPDAENVRRQLRRVRQGLAALN